MFAEIVQVLGDHLGRLLPFVVVNEYEHAVLLRGGKFRRELKAGLHCVWPLWDHVLSTSSVWTTERTTPQSVTTESGVSLVVSLAVTWRVSCAKKFLLEVYDGKGAVLDCIAGATGQVLQTYDGVAPYRSLEREIRKLANRRAEQWGVRFQRVQFADLAKARTLRLVTDHAAPAAALG